MNETICSFGNNDDLVGVITRPHEASHWAPNDLSESIATQDGFESETILGTKSLGQQTRRRPDNPSRPPMALILNAGVVHRSGPFRLHVDLARALATAGYECMRIDLSGLGDSAVRLDSKPGENRALLDAKDAMTRMADVSGCDRFVVIGLCSGAYNGHKVASQEDRVVGAVFLDGLAFPTRKHLRRRRWQKALRFRFWRNAIKRRLIPHAMQRVSADVPGAEEFFEASESAAVVSQQIQQMLDRHASLLYIYTEGYGELSDVDQFDEMFGLVPDQRSLQVEYYRNFEHTYRLSNHREIVVDRIVRWYADRFPIARR
ncbi:alpha/beta fold hydrolase [Crateriforma conspicua]|uniref:Alpha/beta hydrolase family protein n=1 Tax=Crateriforma conspicua TaxID=2527996 RepID=A0A5C5Y2A0_9PLAN|nr:alpha/beta fold hydrolase [Crateriforma conspicua]TWT68939.1 Alpha/beta hydrolase family protein [Crateriforma conspicua]